MKNKKVLIVGKKNHLGWFEHCIDGVKQIDNIHYDKFSINELGISYVPMKIIYKLFSQENKLNELVNHYFIKKIKEFKPDLIVFISGFFIPLELYMIAKGYNINVASWIGDKFDERVEKYINYIDKLYVADTGFIDIARQIGFREVSFLQFGYNNLIHQNYNLDRNNFLNFIGSYTKERNEVLKNLHDFKIQIEGTKWNKLDSISANWIVNNKKISQKKVVDIYNQTTATLNVGQNENIINMVNMRTFEAIACGSCIITDNMKDINYCFEINKEILVYNNMNELMEILNKLEKDRNFISNIAKNGYLRIMKDDNTYKSKMKLVIKECN